MGRARRSTFTAAPSSAHRAREWAVSVLSGWGLDDSANDVALVVGELLANAARHGQGPVEVRIGRVAAGLRIEVADTGGGQVRRRELVEPSATSGRGLLIVDALASGWGVRYGRSGKVVWAEMDT